MARIYDEVQDAQERERLLQDAVQEAELVEKEATLFYRDFTGISPSENCETEIRLSCTRQCSRGCVGFDYRGRFHHRRHVSSVGYDLASDFIDYPEF